MSLEAASMVLLCLLASAIIAIIYLYLLAGLYKLRVNIRDREIVSRDMKIQLLESKCVDHRKIVTGISRDTDGCLVVEIYNDPKKITLSFDDGEPSLLESWGAVRGFKRLACDSRVYLMGI